MSHQFQQHDLFYLTVHDIAPSTQVPPRYHRNGDWCPPRSHGSNLFAGHHTLAHHNTTSYSFNTYTTRLRDRTQPLDDTAFQILQLYRQTSMYYADGGFWLVNYDATDRSIGNGQDSARDVTPERDETGEDNEQFHWDWQRLHFQHYPGISWAAYAGQHQRLVASRPDRTWPDILLPDTYHPDNRRRSSNDSTPLFGSLTGDLAVLLALTALSAAPSGYNVHNRLMETVQGNSWSLPPTARRREGWFNQRGVLVSVYTTPQRQADLVAYEQSPIFA